MVNVQCSLNELSYEFSFTSKYIILQGDSGIGKTTLFDILNSDDSKISGNVKFFIIQKMSIEDVVSYFESVLSNNVDKNIVFYCDEDRNRILRNTEFQSIVSRTDAYFLFVSRHKLIKIPYGVDEVYTVKNVNRNKNVLVKMFPDIVKIPKIFGSSLYLEDSKSSYSYFKTFLNNVYSCGGKSNVNTIMQNTRDSTFIADSLGFGSEIVECTSTAAFRNYTNRIMLIPSFEWWILNNLFECEITTYPELCRNREEYCESELKKMCRINNIDMYSKTSLNKCILGNCCYQSDKCKYYYRGDKNRLVLGDLYDEFIKSFGEKSNSEISPIERLKSMKQEFDG